MCANQSTNQYIKCLFVDKSEKHNKETL